MEDKLLEARKLAAKLYVLHDHLGKYVPGAESMAENGAPNGDMFIRFNDLIPVLERLGYPLGPESWQVDNPLTSDEVAEAYEEVGKSYCLQWVNEGEEPKEEADPQLN